MPVRVYYSLTHTDLFCWSYSTLNKSAGIVIKKKKSRIHSPLFPGEPKAQWLHMWKLTFIFPRGPTQNRTCSSSIWVTRLFNKPHQATTVFFFFFSPLTKLPGEGTKHFRPIEMTFSRGRGHPAKLHWTETIPS